MSIIVTGAAGFIGSNFVLNWLANNHEKVIALDKLTYAGNLENLKTVESNPNYHFVQGDICDREAVSAVFEQYQPDFIMHLAAESHVDRSIDGPGEFVHTNVVGTYELLEAARSYYATLVDDKKASFRFHHISTDEVYGSTKSGMFFEHSLLNPTNPYSATKAAAEHYVRSYGNTFNVEYMIVRPTNNIGKRQHSEKFFPTILKCIKEGRKIPIYGSGRQVREWLFVKDNVKAIEFILKNSNINQTYNIGSSNEITNIEFVEKICKILKIDINEVVEYVKDRPGHDFRYSVSNEKLEVSLTTLLSSESYNSSLEISNTGASKGM